MHNLNIARAFAQAVRSDPALASILHPAYDLLAKTSWRLDAGDEILTFADGASIRLGASRCAACPGASICLHGAAALIVEQALAQSMACC